MTVRIHTLHLLNFAKRRHSRPELSEIEVSTIACILNLRSRAPGFSKSLVAGRLTNGSEGQLFAYRYYLSAHLTRSVYICFLAYASTVAMGQSSGAQPVSQAQSTTATSGALPVYIEEFFLSEAVRSEENGELQLTLSSTAFRGRGSVMDGSSAGLDIEYGLTDRLQLGLEVPYGIQSRPTSEIPTSWSTADLSVLYQFIRGNHPFALSGALGVNAPLTARGNWSYEPELMIAKAFGTLQIHTSVIPELGGGDSSLEYNLAAVRPLSHHFFPTLEFNGRWNAGVNSFYVTPGIYKHLPNRLEMGLAMPMGMGRFSSPVGAVFKMTWEIGGDKDD